jgi:enamine deaminase RidA (YjgF/YER057c/UK114 family)
MAGERRELRPASMARPGGHDSPAVGGAGLVFVAGQLPMAADGSQLNQAKFEVQATQALA